MPVEIGRLAETELPALVALWNAAGLVRPWNEPSTDARRALAAENAIILAARDGTRLVGSAMTGHDGHRGWVYYLAVAPDCRRQGIARQLMSAAQDWCAAAGMPRLNLMVRAGNDDARTFYAALGYHFSDVVVLQKVLDPPTSGDK